MAQVINVEDSVTLIPTGYDADSSSYSSISSSYPVTNGYTNSSSNNYAYVTCKTGSQASTYITFTFDAPDIPEGATIDSVTAHVKGRVSSTSYISTATAQLYSGNTAKGSTTSIRTTTASAQTMTPGSWTAEEFQDLRIRYTATRGTSNTSRAAYIYCYGADVTIAYSIHGTQYSIVATSNVTGYTPTPASQNVMEGEEAYIDIYANSLDDVTITDNDEDVTEYWEQHEIPSQGTINAVPGSDVETGFSTSSGAFYQSSSSSSDAWLRYAIGHSAEDPYDSSSTHNTYVKDSNNTGTGWMIFPFDFSEIPVGATIESVTVKAYGARENATQDTTHVAKVGVYSGTTLKGSEQEFSSTSDSIMTLSNVGTWTRDELQNAKLRFTVGYYGGHMDGVTWTVVYSTSSSGYYYRYTLTNINDDHVIIVDQGGAYIPPEEDPQYTYYSLTVSSINASTDPHNGTTRVIAGSDHTITIAPDDPLLTLALDNGVDITDQLQGGIPNNTYSVATASGASYGFALNNNGYYESQNDGQNNSAAVARVSFNLESAATVTFSYINYAESTYDYGIFGNIDSALGTTYTADSNVYLSCGSASYNTNSVQTLTYTMESGSHFIDVKYRKDSSQNSGNDSLQFKVEITALESSDYTYTLTNINQKHSLVFVFGSVDYYFVTSSGTGARLFPDGQLVKLDGDSYVINIVPNNINATVSLTDNGVTKTSQLIQETGTDKDGQPAVSYKYEIENISADHTIVVSAVSGSAQLYFKSNNVWTAATRVYKKINGAWVEQSDLSAVFDSNTNYLKG